MKKILERISRGDEIDKMEPVRERERGNKREKRRERDMLRATCLGDDDGDDGDGLCLCLCHDCCGDVYCVTAIVNVTENAFDASDLVNLNESESGIFCNNIRREVNQFSIMLSVEVGGE
jgi:hypothetical protein